MQRSTLAAAGRGQAIACGEMTHPQSPALLPLLLFGGMLEVLYLLIVALSSLPELHLSSSPLATAWPWTLLPLRLLFPTSGTASGQDWPYLALLSITLVSLACMYALAVRSVLRRRDAAKSTTVRWLFLLLAGAVLFGLTLLFQPALFSDDVFTYIFSGRILTVYHADPLNTAPIQFSLDPYLQWVVSGRNTPNIYGPLWLIIASLLVSIGINSGPVVTLLLFKGVALLSHLVNCVLVWAILGKIAPSRRLVGTLLYAWNPLVIIELAGSGHSEGVLLSILLLATWLYVRKQDHWHEIAVLVLLGLAISMNLIALLIAPLFTWFMVRTERSILRTLWGFTWRIMVGQMLVLPIYLPFWRGSSTFFSITSAIDIEHFAHSLVGLLAGPAHWIFGLVAQWSHFPPVMQPTTAADGALRASTIFIFALIYFRLFSKVRGATATIAGMRYSPEADQGMLLPGFDVLLECWSIAVFWYMVLVLGWFWPWYVLWVLWIVVLRQLDLRAISLLFLSATALLVYPLQDFARLPIAMYSPVLIFGITLVFLFLNRKKQGLRLEEGKE